MARAMGCSDLASTEATNASTSARSNPGARIRSVSAGLPAVSVPVLSSATTRTDCSACNASPLRNSTPSSAPRPVPTMIDVGVASPIAQGQAMIRTATALTRPKVSAGSGPRINQTAKVSAASPITTGTNHRVMRSTSPWMGSLPPCAASTMRMICASIVASPTAVARKVSAPVWLTVPPVTAAPAALATGAGSPVIMDSSIQLSPAVTSPSTGARSPGRRSSRSPVRTSAIGTSTTVSPRWTRAMRGCKPTNRLIACDVRPLACASRNRPSRISVTMTAAASK